MSLNLGIIASSRGTAAPPAAFLLDTYPGAAAAYSLRKLRTAYTGAAIRVRRSIDNTETDIGFNGSGGLDVTTLTTFVGSNTGYVIKWYDQSGNLNDLANSISNSEAPKIIASGVLQTQNLKPSIYFNSIALQLNTQISSAVNTSVFLTGKANSLSTGGPIFGHTSPGGSGPVMGQYFGNYLMQNYNGSNSTYYLTAANTADTNFNIINQFFTTGNVGTFYKNNTNYAISSSGTFSASSNNFWNLGAYSVSFNTVGFVSEAILYKSNELSNRTGIVNNTNTFYSIF